MTCGWQCQRTSHTLLRVSFSISLLLPKTILFYMGYCFSSPKYTRRLRQGQTYSFLSACHSAPLSDGKSKGCLTCQPHGGSADLPGLRPQPGCLSARVLTSSSFISPAMMLPYRTIEKPELVTSHLCSLSSKGISFSVTEAHKCTRVFNPCYCQFVTKWPFSQNPSPGTDLPPSLCPAVMTNHTLTCLLLRWGKFVCEHFQLKINYLSYFQLNSFL